jgi:hypothetical protein
MSNSISNLRKAESAALADGRLSAEEATTLAKSATTREEKAVVAEMFAHDAFEPKVDKKQLAKLLGVQALPKQDALAGAELPGQKGVFIRRTLGETGGYETKNHALAVARAVGSDKAMVVEGKDGRWHAVETNVPGASAGGGTGKVMSAVLVGKLDPAKYETLRQAAMGSRSEGDWKKFASYALGVPEGEIHVIGKGDTPSSTGVNINLSPDFNAEGRAANFDPKQPPWVQLGPAAFDRPANAAATLAHEEVHASHRRQALELYKQYEGSKHGSDTFRQWAAKNVKDVKKVDIVAGYADGTLGATELMSHLEAAKVAFLSGDLEQAKTDLRKVATLPTMPLRQTTDPAEAALKKLRDSLPADARAVFDEVAKKARSGNVLHGL